MISKNEELVIASAPLEREVAPAFLSSLFGGLKELRQNLKAENEENLWVAEKDRPELKGKPPLEIVDACVEQLKKSSLLICVLASERLELNDSGTPISIGEIQAAVSYFEIEIFQAVLNRIPIIVLEMSDFVPSPRLEEFIKIIQRSGVGYSWDSDIKTYTEICKKVKKLLLRRSEIKKDVAACERGNAGTMAIRLIAARAHLRSARLAQGDILWMNGERVKSWGKQSPSLDRATVLLNVAKSETSHGPRLSRLYLVLSELMTISDVEDADMEALVLWNEAFGLWSSSAAWYGLHNHLGVGVIGTLWSQERVRERIRKANKESSEELKPLHGAMASAYFSLGKVCPIGKWRCAVLRTGLSLANKVVCDNKAGDPGIYAVRGSIHFALLNPHHGMSDFRQLHKLAMSRGDAPGLLAEANTYLGKGLTLLHRFKIAETHLNEAVVIWEDQLKNGADVTEFYVKTLKHLIELQLKMGRINEAKSSAEKALIICDGKGIQDQKFQIEKILNDNKRLK